MSEQTHVLLDLFDTQSRLAGARARRDLDAQGPLQLEIGALVGRLAGLARRPAQVKVDEPPPRPIAIALAQALFAVPHLRSTLVARTTVGDDLAFQPTEALAGVLGVPQWELEELREDIDTRVARLLKQTRVLHWLWARYEHPGMRPEPLFHTLFPGVGLSDGLRFTLSGSRLYAVFPQPAPPPPEALYLRWLAGTEVWSAVPDNHFAARYVDLATMRTLARSVGGTVDELRGVLDNLVCAVPSSAEAAFLEHDRWRSEGWSELTGLGTASTGPEWVTLPLAPDALDADELIQASGEGVTLHNVRRAFDRHALGRLTGVAHGLYAEVCARLVAHTDPQPTGQAALFDLAPYVQRALQPLLAWTTAPDTIRHVAARAGADPAAVAAALARARATWLEAAQTSWGGAPTPERPHTVQTLLATHLAVNQSSLARMARLTPDPRAAHRRVLLLFFAHYIQAAPLARLWRTTEGGLPPTEDVIADWFWGTWQRVLDATDDA